MMWPVPVRTSLMTRASIESRSGEFAPTLTSTSLYATAADVLEMVGAGKGFGAVMVLRVK